MDPDPKFFKSLTRKTFFDRFILLTFTAREFPIAAETVLEVTLGDQEFPVLMNDRAANLDKFGHFSSKKRAGGTIVSRKTICVIMERSFLKIPRLSG